MSEEKISKKTDLEIGSSNLDMEEEEEDKEKKEEEKEKNF